MSRTLFLGCSHTMGYRDFDEDDEPNVWLENNYAEIYSDHRDKKVVIMASAGAGNREVVNFLAHAFKVYNDIDKVFIQSTYWNRFPIAINPDLDVENIYDLDHFIEKDFSSHNIDRWSLGLVQERHAQVYMRPLPIDYETPYIKETSPGAWPNLQRSSFIYVKMYHYLFTHLAQQDYFRDIFMCDSLCSDNNAELYLWNINERCYIPKETENFYGKLKSTKIAPVDARRYIKDKHQLDIENEKVDTEHYNVKSHTMIADKYIPFLENL